MNLWSMNWLEIGYAPAYYGHHASAYAPGYGYSSHASYHYNYAPYGYETYYSNGGRHPYSAGSSAYAPGYQSHGYGYQSHGYGNVKYAAGTPFLYNRVPGYYWFMILYSYKGVWTKYFTHPVELLRVKSWWSYI